MHDRAAENAERRRANEAHALARKTLRETDPIAAGKHKLATDVIRMLKEDGIRPGPKEDQLTGNKLPYRCQIDGTKLKRPAYRVRNIHQHTHPKPPSHLITPHPHTTTQHTQICSHYLNKDNRNTALSERLVNHFAEKLSKGAPSKIISNHRNHK